MKFKSFMKESLTFLLTAFILVSYYLANQYFVKDISTNTTVFIALALVFTIITYALFVAKNSIKTDFLFEVTPNKQRCSIGYTGLPHLNFEYVPDYDRMSMPYCDDVNSYNQAKLLKTPKDETAKDDQAILQNAFLY